MSDRRLDARLLCADMVDVEWIDASGTERREIALLEDISALGLCLQTENALPENSQVTVTLNSVPVELTVRYCEWREIGYFAGLNFAPGSQWLPEDFSPQHLTDPLILPLRKSGFIV